MAYHNVHNHHCYHCNGDATSQVKCMSILSIGSFLFIETEYMCIKCIYNLVESYFTPKEVDKTT